MVKHFFSSESLLTPIVFLLVVRILGGRYAVINDCDEVYNYWEPIHYLTYGNAFQTWEYDAQYAIRTYAYILLYAWPISIMRFLLEICCPIIPIILPGSWLLSEGYAADVNAGKGAPGSLPIPHYTLFYLARVLWVVIPCFLSELFLVYSVRFLESVWAEEEWISVIHEDEQGRRKLTHRFFSVSRNSQSSTTIAQKKQEQEVRRKLKLIEKYKKNRKGLTRGEEKVLHALVYETDDTPTPLPQRGNESMNWLVHALVCPHHLSGSLCYTLACSSAMFIASGALLPSSFFMVIGNLVWGLWIRSEANRYRSEGIQMITVVKRQGKETISLAKPKIGSSGKMQIIVTNPNAGAHPICTERRLPWNPESLLERAKKAEKLDKRTGDGLDLNLDNAASLEAIEGELEKALDGLDGVESTGTTNSKDTASSSATEEEWEMVKQKKSLDRGQALDNCFANEEQEHIAKSMTTRKENLLNTAQTQMVTAVILSVFVTLISSWPFGAVVFVGFCLFTFYTYGIVMAVTSGVIGVILNMIAIIIFDWQYYQVRPGKEIVRGMTKLGPFDIFITPLNTFLYNNPFGGKDRSQLYGVESITYYPKNLVLNFNVVMLFAVVGVLSVWLPKIGKYVLTLLGFQEGSKTEVDQEEKSSPWAHDFDNMMENLGIFRHLSIPWCSWVCILSFIAHKEERFLYVVYPLICLSAAIGVVKITGGCRLMVFIAAPVSFLRIMCLVSYLGEPVMDVWKHAATLTAENPRSVVCLSDDWYRFPSHFFVEPSTAVHFVESKFKGILPAHFPGSLANTVHDQKIIYQHPRITGLGRKLLSNIVAPAFNDNNGEEKDRYVKREHCDYIVDSFTKKDLVQIQVQAEFCRPIVDLSQSRFPFRSFYFFPINSNFPLVSPITVRKYLTLRYYCVIDNKKSIPPSQKNPSFDQTASHWRGNQQQGDIPSSRGRYGEL